MTADPRSGLDEHGEWTPAFPGQRPPFSKGHELTVTHGAYARIKLAPRAAELAEGFREIAPLATDADAPGFAALGLVAAQLEAATMALEDADPADMGRLRQDARGWSTTFLKYLDRFGMTPAARAKLGLDVARTGEALKAHLDANYGRTE